MVISLKKIIKTINKDIKYPLIYNDVDIIDVMSILIQTSEKTEKLLEEKGFETDIEDFRIQKIVLIMTEISELADAVKKGKGTEEEGLELADIVIRITNLLVAPQTKKLFKGYSNVFLDNIKEFNNCKIVIPMTKDNIRYKFSLIEKMMILWRDLDINLCRFISDKTDENFIVLMNTICNLVSYCVFYSKSRCNKTLQDFIKLKMDANFKRPYRYNTSEDFRG